MTAEEEEEKKAGGEQRSMRHPSLCKYIIKKFQEQPLGTSDPHIYDWFEEFVGGDHLDCCLTTVISFEIFSALSNSFA